MKEAFIDETPRIMIHRENFESLRRASGIDSEGKLAEILGVSRTTLWRYSTGKVAPTADFIARTLVAFPHTGFEHLFRVEAPKAVAR
jgi:predicted transcriptional regulator